MKLKKVLLHLSNTEGRVANVYIECTVADNFHLECVILFKGDSVVNQLRKQLVGGECEFLLFSQCRMGVGISMGVEGTGVDGTVASVSKEEFGGSGVEVVVVEGCNGLNLFVKDEVWEQRHILVLVVVN